MNSELSLADQVELIKETAERLEIDVDIDKEYADEGILIFHMSSMNGITILNGVGEARAYLAGVEANTTKPQYTLMTKTTAKKAVANILKFAGFTCYNDQVPKPDPDDGCCSVCPVIRILGHDAGERMCQREKRWSK